MAEKKPPASAPGDGAGAGQKVKKQIPLRLSASLYDALAAWAEDDFRSLNGQIEYLLTECVKKRGRNKPGDPAGK
ncbi:MAG: Arc family DNA-binding protein [Peptococcaceae bacterium]|jgi:hypothetical protein|nr:Arc family DNA-binding protein [Peptococcaceae bacterium]